MKPWQFAVVSLALLATTGCRSDPAVPILERELRRKEDEIYRLRGQLEEFQDCGTCQEVTSVVSSWQWESSTCETLGTEVLGATCQDAEGCAEDVVGLFLSAFAFSSPWRRRQVVWWWRARATCNGV